MKTVTLLQKSCIFWFKNYKNSEFLKVIWPKFAAKYLEIEFGTLYHGNLSWKGRPNTEDLLASAGVDQLFLILLALLTFWTKQATIMKSWTVLSLLPFQIVFHALTMSADHLGDLKRHLSTIITINFRRITEPGKKWLRAFSRNPVGLFSQHFIYLHNSCVGPLK